MPAKTMDLRPQRLRDGVPKAPEEPYVAPGVDPAAAVYAQRMAERRRASQLPKGGEPVGGGEAPRFPRLDAPHQQGMTMRQQAEFHAQSNQVTGVPGNIVETPVDPRMSGPKPRTNLALQPGDVLPEEALQDPTAQKGPGSAQAHAQPHLAAKYGVIRGGMRVPAQLLMMQGQQGQQQQLSPQTLAGLQAINKAAQNPTIEPSSPPDGMPKTEEEALKDFEDSPAAASKDASNPLTEKERKEIQKAVNDMDSFDYSKLREQMDQDMLNNLTQKRIIESRLKPLSIDDLIVKNRVSQDVPIIPTTSESRGFVIRYTSMTGEEELALKRLVMEEANSIEVTQQYLLDKYSFMAITCGLTAINGNAAPTHLNDTGDFDEKRFWVKFRWTMKRNIHMLSSIGVHHTYFEMRVRGLFVAEKLGNG